MAYDRNIQRLPEWARAFLRPGRESGRRPRRRARRHGAGPGNGRGRAYSAASTLPPAASKEHAVKKESIQIDRDAMRRLLADRKDTAEEAILRLAWQQGLTRDEIQRLTWADVALEEGLLRLPDRAVPLEPDCRTAWSGGRSGWGRSRPMW